MERFYNAFNRFDAYLLLHRLQQAGIVAHVFNEHVQSIVGDVPPDVAQPQVWLERASDRPRAEAVLAGVQGHRQKTGGGRWTSRGEDNPENLGDFWESGGGLEAGVR